MWCFRSPSRRSPPPLRTHHAAPPLPGARSPSRRLGDSPNPQSTGLEIPFQIAGPKGLFSKQKKVPLSKTNHCQISMLPSFQASPLIQFSATLWWLDDSPFYSLELIDWFSKNQSGHFFFNFILLVDNISRRKTTHLLNNFLVGSLICILNFITECDSW